MKKLILKKKADSSPAPVKSSKKAPKKDEGENVTLSAYIPADIKAFIETKAKKDDRNISYVVRQMLEFYMSKHK